MPTITRGPSFDQAMRALKRDARKVYRSATEVLIELQLGDTPTAPMRAEGRIPNCCKYELQDGFRLVLQRAQSGDGLIALMVGRHAHVDAFLDRHKREWFDPSACDPLPLRKGPGDRARTGKGLGHVRSDLPAPRPDTTAAATIPGSASRQLFADISDDELTEVGLLPDHIKGLRRPYESPDAPELMNHLATFNESGREEQALLLLDHAVKPSHSTLRELRALAASSATPIPTTVPAARREPPDAAPAAPKSKPRRKRAIKRSGVRGSGRGQNSKASSALADLKRRMTRTSVQESNVKRPAKKKVATRRVKAKRVTTQTVTMRPKPSTRGKALLTQPTPRVARRGTSDLPRVLSMDAVMRYLHGKGFRAVDNRTLGGGVWVMTQERKFADHAAKLASRGVRCKFFPPGTRRKEDRASWLIDAFKRLS